MARSFLARIFQTVDALTLPAEDYLQRYRSEVKPPALTLTGGWNGGVPEAGPLRVLISGGERSVRERLMWSLVERLREAGRSLVVVQAEERMSDVHPAGLKVLRTQDGSYDPLKGRSSVAGLHLLLGAAAAEGLKQTDVFTPLSDEIHYLSDNLSMEAFLALDSRRLGAEAFQREDDILAASHSLPGSLHLDYLRERLCYGSCRRREGESLSQAAQPGRGVCVGVPNGNAAWIGAVLAELNDLCRTVRNPFVVFSDIYIPETCRSGMEILTCGRCICSSDLPAEGWLWTFGTKAATTGLLLRHSGQSAEVISQYFHQVQREQVTRAANRGQAQCDCGGFMGLFGSCTISTATTVTTAQQWEPRFSADRIEHLRQTEGIFTHQGQAGICTIET